MSKIEQPILNEKDIAIDRAIVSSENEFLRTGKMFDARETLAALREKYFE